MTCVPPWSRPERVAVAALGLLSLVVLTFGLGEPDRLMFDEVYYVNDARDLLAHGEIRRDLVHPPLAVQLIAGSIRLLGDHAAAWRLPSALAGVTTVVLTTLLARRLTARTWLALLAGGLVLADGVFAAQARIAMLDAVVVALVVTAAWALAIDRAGRTHPRADGGVGPRSVPWGLLGAGAALGLAGAAKWSGLFALAGVAALAVAWEVGRWRRMPPRATSRRRAAAWLVVAFALLPAATYTATWVPWMVSEQNSVAGDCPAPQGCTGGPVAAVGALAGHHLDLLRFHDGFTGTHRYQAPPTTWLVQTRPVTFLWQRCDAQGRDRDDRPCAPAQRATQVVSLGNLALWGSGLMAVPMLAAGLARRDDRSALVLTMLVVQYVPWLLVDRPTFSFYAVTLVPFMALAVVVALDDLGGPRCWRWAWRSATTAAALTAAIATAITARVDLVVAWALLAATMGAGVGGVADRAGDGSVRPRPRLQQFTAATVTIAAAGLLVWFAPVWFGIDGDLESVRARWWLPSWI